MALPVARVVLDGSLPHLDREFEYSVPAELDLVACPGVRVRVRFAGRDTAGYVVGRVERAEHAGRLTPLRTVVSPEPVLTEHILRVARAVAGHYAGTLGDVLRLAIPPRHATAEKALTAATDAAGRAAAPPGTDHPSPDAWSRYPGGPQFLQQVAAGDAPAAVWTASPACGAGPGRTDAADWPEAIAQAAAVALAAGRGVVIVVPDHRDVTRVDVALTHALGTGQHVRLTADQGPQARYTAWLKLLRGRVRCAVGNRAAAFAPVTDPGLFIWWDDGDDLLVEPRAPYPHVRQILRIRAQDAGAALLSGAFARSVAVQALGLPEIAARGPRPAVHIAGDELERERSGPAATARIPTRAWQLAHDGLQHGPVLVQVPRRGYLPALRCAECGTRATCSRCQGPMALSGPDGPPVCRWCGAHGTSCRECGSTALRATVVGARRTAEELGRAFAGVPVVQSGAREVLAVVPADPALVISTPGAEPIAAGGYHAALLLDAWALTERPTLDAGEEALRRWLAAAALVRVDAAVVLCGVSGALPVHQALVGWQPAAYADRELADRTALGFPPARWMALLRGQEADVRHFAAGLPPDWERLATATETILRSPIGEPDPAKTLKAVRSRWSAAKSGGPVAVRVDPTGAEL